MRVIIHKNLEKYMEIVCERDCIPFVITAKEEEKIFMKIPDTADPIELLEDILCEQQRDLTDSKIPVYSHRTLLHKEKRNRLMEYYEKKASMFWKKTKKNVEKMD